MEAREPIAFDEDDAMSGSRQPGSRRRTGGAAAGDDHVTVERHDVVVCHSASGSGAFFHMGSGAFFNFCNVVLAEIEKGSRPPPLKKAPDPEYI